MHHDTAFCRAVPDLLATGYPVGMMELACTQGVMACVAWPREQSLGPLVNFSHFAPTPSGMQLAVRGEVIAVEGCRVRYQVEPWDEVKKISEKIHERHVIRVDKFNSRLASKLARNGA